MPDINTKVIYASLNTQRYGVFALKTVPNSSEIAGFLSADNGNLPLQDLPLLIFLQKTISGITGLPGNLVRPSFQEIPPNLLELPENWLTFYIRERKGDVFSHQSLNDDASIFTNQRTEECNILISLYGPQAEQYASIFRSGIELGQNLDKLEAVKISSIECQDIYFVPELINNRWFRKVDMLWRIRRVVDYNYNIYDILCVNGTITNDNPLLSIDFANRDCYPIKMVYSTQSLSGYSILESQAEPNNEVRYTSSTLLGYKISPLQFIQYQTAGALSAYPIASSINNAPAPITYTPSQLSGYAANAYIANRYNQTISYGAQALTSYPINIATANLFLFTYNKQGLASYPISTATKNIYRLAYNTSLLTGYNAAGTISNNATINYSASLLTAYAPQITSNDIVNINYNASTLVSTYPVLPVILSNRAISYNSSTLLAYGVMVSIYYPFQIFYNAGSTLTGYAINSYINAVNILTYQSSVLSGYQINSYSGTIVRINYGSSKLATYSLSVSKQNRIFTRYAPESSLQGYSISLTNPSFAWDEASSSKRWDAGLYRL